MKNYDVTVSYRIGDKEIKTFSFSYANSLESIEHNFILEKAMKNEVPDLINIYPLVSDAAYGNRNKVPSFNELKSYHNINYLKYEINGISYTL